MEYYLEQKYEIVTQPIGTFLSDFLNTDFESYDDFCNLFIKYGLALIDSSKISKEFKVNSLSENIFRDFVTQILNKYKNKYIKLQEQTDMIIDYCLLSPNKKAIEFKPIERLYVLRRISPTLTLLNENKAAYYSTNLFSSYPGKTEKEIYDFLSKKKNKVTEFDLILPYDLSAMLYKSICSVLKEEVYLKVCKNCNKYFIATNKSSNYCQNIAPNEASKTCRDIGRKNVFNNNINNDAVLSYYYQIYNRKSMMKSRNPDIATYVNDFNKYKEVGKKKVHKYKNGLITSEEFKKWIDKNK